MVSFLRNIYLAFRSVGLYFAAFSRLDSESESATSTVAVLWQL
jgi:hypothetical protein